MLVHSHRRLFLIRLLHFCHCIGIFVCLYALRTYNHIELILFMFLPLLFVSKYCSPILEGAIEIVVGCCFWRNLMIVLSMSGDLFI